MFALDHHAGSSAVSFQEQGSLSGWLKNPAATLGNANFAFCTRHPVDATLLERSLAAVCLLHDALLTRFARDEQGGLQRRLLPSTSPIFSLQTMRYGASIDDPAVSDQVTQFCSHPFRVSSTEWLRVLLIHTADRGSVIVVRMPHLICDAVGMSIFVGDVWKYYEAFATDGEPRIVKAAYTLRDYAASQLAWAATPDFERQIEKQLAHCVAQMQALLALEPTQPVPRVTRNIIGTEAFLPPDVQDQLAALVKKTRANPATVLLACSMVCISRVYGQREFCLRMPFSARVSHQFERIVGFLSTDLIMFTRLDTQQTFLQFIAHMQRESLNMMRHGALPWGRIRERMRAQVSDVLLSDYTVNIIPPQPSFSEQAEFETHPFPVPVFGDANYRLKVLITQHAKGTRIALRLGEEEQARAETELMPAFMNTLCTLIGEPELSLQQALEATGRFP